MKSNRYKDYTVFEWEEERDTFHLEQLLSRYPSLVQDKYVVITSWDSGTYRPTEQEMKSGWQVQGNLAHSPQVHEWSSLPFELYDEWYIFENPVCITELEPLVNYQGFSPINFEWKEKRELFWKQIRQFHPLHVVGDGRHLFLVTRDNEIIKNFTEQAHGE